MASSPLTTQQSLINPPTSGVTQTGLSVGHAAPTKPNNILKPSSIPHGKKISKSTLKFKGLWVPPQPNTEANEVQEEQPSVRTRKRTRVRLDNDVGVSNVSGALSDSSGTDSKGDYQPDQGSDVETESDDDEMEYEEGDINELLNQNYVDGVWEPFRTNEWVVDDDSYTSRLYRNGEVFEEAEFGKIRLKQWQFFVDKEHFKDALRDFCIQEGFALVVNKRQPKI
ncbi:uncharacterized protein LOC110706941 [Chenopodium quinoa]|uniref:uncharacterized protein LOC110706941 n=1 Tax=Chenopodium quinoa TaxID=63459 RepID=UPI000B792D55|nr:uncharacterized protein LOC110706941 [Chenopodium quinoa]